MVEEWKKIKDANDLDKLRGFVKVFGGMFDAGIDAKILLAEKLAASGNEDDGALERLERRYCTQPEYGPPVRSRFYAAAPRRASAKAQTQSAPATTRPSQESSSGTVQPPICAGQAYASRRIWSRVMAPNTNPVISK